MKSKFKFTRTCNMEFNVPTARLASVDCLTSTTTLAPGQVRVLLVSSTGTGNLKDATGSLFTRNVTVSYSAIEADCHSASAGTDGTTDNRFRLSGLATSNDCPTPGRLNF